MIQVKGISFFIWMIDCYPDLKKMVEDSNKWNENTLSSNKSDSNMKQHEEIKKHALISI